jgi:hypothetical protein
MFSIPFFTGKFVETTRYFPFYIYYLRYIGILIIPAIGGLIYLILKKDRGFGDWFLLLSLILLVTFIYEQTYMKGFIPIFIIPFSCIGLLNIIKLTENRKYAISMVTFFLILSIIFSGYYQFLHSYDEDWFNARYIEETTYKTGGWVKNNLNGSAISNDVVFSLRLFATSENVHIFTDGTIYNQIYGFNVINMSQFKLYPLMSEDFWFSGYEGPDVGQISWEEINELWKSPNDFNISYFVENAKTNGDIVWNHGLKPSKLLYKTYSEGALVFDIGTAKIWRFG